jgi:glucose-1-phosphate thymidylyltransferase
MKCLILAAGYATRLYPLTENFPKPLLEVAGKTILDWLIDDMARTGLVDEYIVISNHKFAHIFEEWAAAHDKVKITVLDDGTTSNDNRLGAVRDIQFAIEQLQLDDDLLVMAGDNLLDFSMGEFIRYAADKKATCVMSYYVADKARLQKSGVAELDADRRIVSMVEKPAEPRSNWCVPAFYCYTREDSHLISKGIECGCGVDAPGSFIAWLADQTSVYAWEMPGKRYDIGNLESYEQVKRVYRGV